MSKEDGVNEAVNDAVGESAAMSGKGRYRLPKSGWAVPVIGTHLVTRERWLETRRGMRTIGASQVASVLGMSPYGTPYEVWAKLLGRIETEDSKAMEVGTQLERLISAEVAKRLGVPHLEVAAGEDLPETPGVYGWRYILRHPEVEVLTTNLDNVVVEETVSGIEKGVLEIKWHNWRLAEAYDAFEKHGLTAMYGTAIASHYVQIQSQLAVLGPEFTFGYLGACVGEWSGLLLALGLEPDDKEIHLYRFDRDEEFIATIEKQVPAFYNRYVRTGQSPPALNERDGKYVRMGYPSPKNEEGAASKSSPTALPEAAAEAAANVIRTRAAKKEAAAAEATAAAEMIRLMGESETSYGAVKGLTVTYFADKRGRRTLRVKEDSK